MSAAAVAAAALSLPAVAGATGSNYRPTSLFLVSNSSLQVHNCSSSSSPSPASDVVRSWPGCLKRGDMLASSRSCSLSETWQLASELLPRRHYSRRTLLVAGGGLCAVAGRQVQDEKRMAMRWSNGRKRAGEGTLRRPKALRSVNSAAAEVTTEEENVLTIEETEVEILERDFQGTPFIPIYVMLPLGTINESNQVNNLESFKDDLKALKAVNVDGVMVDCWWGLVEAEGPQKYDWSGYKQLFNIVREAGLKLQVVMSFHQCGGNVGDDINIPIPQWVLDIGKANPDIFFTDRLGERNPECLTWGVDKQRVLNGRTGLEVYYDYMRSFRQDLCEFFDDGTITEIEIGLGACGELRYPSYPETLGWKYPGIGEFQCYDKYIRNSLTEAAKLRGHPEWASPPDDAGQYNSKPQDTDFFRDGGYYDSYYGRFFLKWYSQVLIEHGNNVLTLANLAFEGMKIAAKVSGIHWWYKSASHAAELCAGFYNTAHRDGYLPIAQMLAKHNAAFNFTCVELSTLAQEEGYPEALADPEGLVWQVLNAAWDSDIAVASENALPCYDRHGYNKILENAKPLKDPDGRHLVAFTYLRLNPTLMEATNLEEFARFVRRLHGEATNP